jgi:hypothetical protein
MRTVLLTSITLATLMLCIHPTHAGPWCAYYSGRGGSNCGFYSFEQCQATVSGRGGFCNQNPFESSRSSGRRWR